QLAADLAIRFATPAADSPSPPLEERIGERTPELSHANPIVALAFSTNPPASMKEVADRYGTLLNNVDKEWQDLLAHQVKNTTNVSSPSTLDPRPSSLSNPAAESLRQILYAADAPANVPVAEFDRLYDVPTSQKLRELQRKIDELDATHPGAPPR